MTSHVRKGVQTCLLHLLANSPCMNRG